MVCKKFMHLHQLYFNLYAAAVNCSSNNCAQGCANINGNNVCFCVPGYQLNMDNVTCSGIPVLQFS